MTRVVKDPPPVSVTSPRASAAEYAVLSALIPGLGQFAQRRFIAGASQLGTVIAYALPPVEPEKASDSAAGGRVPSTSVLSRG